MKVLDLSRQRPLAITAEMNQRLRELADQYAVTEQILIRTAVEFLIAEHDAGHVKFEWWN